MKEFKELNVLENTAESVKERIAEEFPPQDNKEKERVFRMSERKYNIKKNNNSTDEHFIGEETVNGVEVYKRPKWKIFTTLAACAVIAAGIGGGGYLMKHIKSNIPDTVMSELKDTSTAPFGDFAASEYYIPDYKSEQKTFHFNKYNHDVPYYDGEVISYEKRKKIADFFNSQEWKEAAPNEANEDGRKIKMTDEEIAENYITFQYVTDNEIRKIEISNENILTYNYFEIKEENGEKVCDNSYVQEYEIDWELFKSTINDILNGTDSDTEKAVAPFGDFSELDYYIAGNDINKSVNVYLNETDDNSPVFCLMDGKPIEQEKRDKLADFFNSYTWEPYTQPESNKDTDIPNPNEDKITFIYRNDTEVRMIEIEKSDVLVYSHFDYITDENGKLIKVNYGEADETDFPYELFKVDYELFKKTIDDILSESSSEPPVNDIESFITIVNIFEKYDFNLDHLYSDDETTIKRNIRMVKSDDPDSEMGLSCGSALSGRKHDKIVDIIKNAAWKDENELTEEDIAELENIDSASGNQYSIFSFINITGNDIISVDIYSNCIYMTRFECDYDETNDIYIVKNIITDSMITTSPTFMSEIYDAIYNEEDNDTVTNEKIIEDVNILDKVYSSELHLIDILHNQDSNEKDYAHQRFIKCSDSEYAPFIYGSRVSEEENQSFKNLLKNSDLTPVAYDSIDWLKGTKPYNLYADYASADGDNFLTVSFLGDNRLYVLYYECSKPDKNHPAFSSIEEDHTRNEMFRDEYYQSSKIHVAVFETSDTDFHAKAEEIYNKTAYNLNHQQIVEVNYSESVNCYTFMLHFPYDMEGISGRYSIDVITECDGKTNSYSSDVILIPEAYSLPINIYPIEGAESNDYTVTMKLKNLSNNKSNEILNYSFPFSVNTSDIITLDLISAFRSVE